MLIKLTCVVATALSYIVLLYTFMRTKQVLF